MPDTEYVPVNNVVRFIGLCPRCTYKSAAERTRREADAAVRSHIQLVHVDGVSR